MSKQFYLELKQSNGHYISPWKISNLIDDLAEDYYKKYILDLIADKIPNLKKDEEIIIFDSSFDLYQQYKSLSNFSLLNKEDALNTYYLGNLIPLRPNFKIYKLSLLFELHRKLFTRLNAVGILIERDRISDYISVNFNNDNNFDFELLRNYVQDLLLSSEKKLQTALKDCNELFDKYVEKLLEYEKNLLKFELVNGMQSEKEVSEFLKNENNSRFYKKYYRAFETNFNRHGRPIVGIINTDEQSLEIFAKEFIREDLQDQNDNKLEMVNLSRNSPTILGYIAGTIIISWLSQLMVTHLETKKIQQQSTLALDSVDLQVDDDVQELDDLINNYKEMQKERLEIQSKVINFNDYKMKKSILNMDIEITQSTRNTLDKNDFLNKNIRFRPLDNDIDERDETEE